MLLMPLRAIGFRWLCNKLRLHNKQPQLFRSPRGDYGLAWRQKVWNITRRRGITSWRSSTIQWTDLILLYLWWLLHFDFVGLHTAAFNVWYFPTKRHNPSVNRAHFISFSDSSLYGGASSARDTSSPGDVPNFLPSGQSIITSGTPEQLGLLVM